MTPTLTPTTPVPDDCYWTVSSVNVSDQGKGEPFTCPVPNRRDKMSRAPTSGSLSKSR